MLLRYYILFTRNYIPSALIKAARGFVLGHTPVSWLNWHNHYPDTQVNVHTYPRVQYKLINNRFAIVALESEKEKLFQLAARFPLEGTLNKQPARFEFDRIQYYEHYWDFVHPAKTYRCSNFLPMKTEQYTSYKDLCKEHEINPNANSITAPVLLSYVEQLLTKRMQEQVVSLDAPLSSDLVQVKLSSTSVQHSLTRYFNNMPFSKFSQLVFTANINWPIHLGLGFGASIGYGMLKPSGKERKLLT